MKRGLFIVFEGIDGSGKSSQINRLHNYIKTLSKYNNILTTREPWRDEEIKKILKEEKDSYSSGEKIMSLFVKDRANHLSKLINPTLEQETIVISDRYLLSTYAYQQTQGVKFEKIKEQHQLEKIIIPDLTFLIDIDLKTAKERIKKRGESCEKFEINSRFIQENILQYEKLAQKSKEKGMEEILGKIEIINGRNSEEEVFEELKIPFDLIYNQWKN